MQLGQALSRMGQLDIYASDACLMQMAEVIYELKNYVPVIVGSEEIEPNEGWDYTAFLSRLTSPVLDAETVAVAAVDGYHASYSLKNKGVTISAVRTAVAEDLRGLTDEWVDLAMRQDKTALREIAREPLTFKEVDSRDFLHFMAMAGTKMPVLKAKGEEITALVKDRMVIKSATVGSAYAEARGLAIYLPPIFAYNEEYSKLALSRAGKWDEFLRWLTVP